MLGSDPPSPKVRRCHACGRLYDSSVVGSCPVCDDEQV